MDCSQVLWMEHSGRNAWLSICSIPCRSVLITPCLNMAEHMMLANNNRVFSTENFSGWAPPSVRSMKYGYSNATSLWSLSVAVISNSMKILWDKAILEMLSTGQIERFVVSFQPNLTAWCCQKLSWGVKSTLVWYRLLHPHFKNIVFRGFFVWFHSIQNLPAKIEQLSLLRHIVTISEKFDSSRTNPILRRFGLLFYVQGAFVCSYEMWMVYFGVAKVVSRKIVVDWTWYTRYLRRRNV